MGGLLPSLHSADAASNPGSACPPVCACHVAVVGTSVIQCVLHRRSKVLPVGLRAALKLGEVLHGSPLQRPWELKHYLRQQVQDSVSVALISCMYVVAVFEKLFSV